MCRCRQTSDTLYSSPIQLQRGFHTEASQPTYSKGYSIFLFLSPLHGGKGRGQHCFSSCSVKTQRTRFDSLNNAVGQITSMFSTTDQWCGNHKNGDRFTANRWPVSSPKVAALTEMFTSRCCSQLACQWVRQKALTTNTGFISTQAREACYYGGLAKRSRLDSVWAPFHPRRSTAAACMQSSLWAAHLN